MSAVFDAPARNDDLKAVYGQALQACADALRPASLLARAEQAAGLSDWGGPPYEEVGFRRRLDGLCEELEAIGQLSVLGRSRAHSRLHVMLCSRLRLIAWLKSNGPLTPIVAPVIGAGLPRTGTTFLHGLITNDPQFVWASTAQCAMPVPGSGGEAARDALFSDIYDFQGFMADDVLAIHPFAPTAPEECVYLQEGACGHLYRAFFNAPKFAALASSQIDQAYAWQVVQMQMLQTARPGATWCLKTPAHLVYWDVATTTFPDARIYVNHRDPAKVIPSIASLYMKLRSLFSDALPGEKEELGPQLLGGWSAALANMTAWRKANPQAKVIDVHYKELTADPMSQVERLYAAFDLELSAQAKDRIARHLAVDPHTKGSRHSYTLAEYGLTEDDIEAAFGAYIDSYGITRESRR